MRTVSTCLVEGCKNPAGRTGGRGCCRKHYMRLRAHGDPRGGGTEKGEARSFVEMAAASTVSACITFPYFRNIYGYGHLNLDSGRYIGAHVYACELSKGPRPSPAHEARHSCGNGHEGCVNGSHLDWGTRKENVRDAIEHGTAVFWGVPVSAYKEFRETIEGKPDSQKTKEFMAANDNVPVSGRMAA